MERIGDDERRRRLATRHLLVPDARCEGVADVTDALVALHSSDPTTVFLAAATRMRAPTVESIEHELYASRGLLRHHAMRRTIWVMDEGTARQAHAGFSRRIAAAERRRTAKLFAIDADAVDEAVDRVVAVITARNGPTTTRDVAAALPDLAEPIIVNQGKNYEGKLSLHTRALLLAAFEARIARGRPAGTWIGSQYEWVAHDAADDWASEPDELTGATYVVRRYLERFGPATFDDVVWWTGSTKTLVHRALAALGAVEVELDGGSVGLVAPADDSPSFEPQPWVALLPALDPTAMGWKRRAWYLDASHADQVTDRNGNLGPTVWADGRVVGGWAQRPDGTVAHDADLDAAHRRLLQSEVERLTTFLGDTRFSARFPSPNQARLLQG